MKDQQIRDNVNELKLKMDAIIKLKHRLLNKETSAKLIIFRGDKQINEPDFIEIDIEKWFIY